MQYLKFCDSLISNNVYVYQKNRPGFEYKHNMKLEGQLSSNKINFSQNKDTQIIQLPLILMR